jgi:hypothetical protein
LRPSGGPALRTSSETEAAAVSPAGRFLCEAGAPSLAGRARFALGRSAVARAVGELIPRRATGRQGGQAPEPKRGLEIASDGAGSARWPEILGRPGRCGASWAVLVTCWRPGGMLWQDAGGAPTWARTNPRQAARSTLPRRRATSADETSTVDGFGRHLPVCDLGVTSRPRSRALWPRGDRPHAPDRLPDRNSQNAGDPETGTCVIFRMLVTVSAAFRTAWTCKSAWNRPESSPT